MLDVSVECWAVRMVRIWRREIDVGDTERRRKKNGRT